MNIKKLIAATAFAGLVFTTPVLAAECVIATQEAAQEAVAKTEGLQHRMLTDGEAQRLLDTKGTPPNATEGIKIEFELIYNDELAGVNVYQAGCFINRLGPSLKQTIYEILGLVDARLDATPQS